MAIAARHAVGTGQLFAAVGGQWQESWWVKSLLELGIVGLITVVLLYGQLILERIRAHSLVRDPALRSASAALLALLIWTAVYNTKSQYVDFDPLNVYFWLFAGFLVKIHHLSQAKPVADPPASTPAR